MSEFDGYRFTVITRTNTTYGITTDFDVDLADLPSAVSEVLPLGNRRALIRCGNEVATASWDGTALALGEFTTLWESAMTIPISSAVVSNDRSVLMVPAWATGTNPNIHGSSAYTKLHFYPITDGVIELANPQIMSMDWQYSSMYTYPLDENEFAVYSGSYARFWRINVADGTLVRIENSFFATMLQSKMLVVPGTRILLIDSYDSTLGAFALRGVDVDTGAISERVVDETPLDPVYRTRRLWPLAGAAALTYARYRTDVAGLVHETIRPIGFDGVTPYFAGDERVLANFPYTSAGSFVCGIEEGTVIGDHLGPRTDFSEYDHGSGYHYQLGSLDLAAQAVGYLDGAGTQILDAKEPASSPSQYWGVEHVVPLGADVLASGLSAQYREGRAAFAPV